MQTTPLVQIFIAEKINSITIVSEYPVSICFDNNTIIVEDIETKKYRIHINPDMIRQLNINDGEKETVYQVVPHSRLISIL